MIKRGITTLIVLLALDSVSIGFERTPRLKDLVIFVGMAKHLDALLLKNGTVIIDEKAFETLK